MQHFETVYVQHCVEYARILVFLDPHFPVLTHFSPVSHFYTPWKRQKTLEHFTAYVSASAHSMSTNFLSNETPYKLKLKLSQLKFVFIYSKETRNSYHRLMFFSWKY